MARIVVLVSNPCTGDARVIKMARAAAAAGHEVHVLATMAPNASAYEKVDGVNYHRLEFRPGQMLTASGPLKLLQRLNRRIAGKIVRTISPYLKYRLFEKIFAATAAGLRPDIVHAHDLICLPAGHAAAQQAGAKLVYDAHELELHRNPPLPFLQRRMVGYVERKFARDANVVITVGKLVAGELAKHLERNDIHVIYNNPVIEPCKNSIRADLRIDDQVPLVVYVGKVAEGRGTSKVLELLPQIPGAVLAAVGPCDARTRKELEAYALKNDLAKRFCILPPVPNEQVVDYIRGADVGIISVEPVTLSYQYSMPNKLFEMSFADVPIVSNKLDEIEMFLDRFGNGEVIDFDQKPLLSYTIARVLNEKQTYKIKPAVRRELEAEYSWDAQARKLLSIYSSLYPLRLAA